MASIRWKLSLTLLGCAALLAGCASVRDVQSDVQSFSALSGLPVPPTYRLELLPSQAQAPQFAVIEAQAQQSLAKVGLRRDDSQASLVVQIGAQARYTRDMASYYGPYAPYGPRWNWGLGFGRGAGWGMGFGGFMFDTPPLLHYRAVNLVMREQRTQRIVYETSAVHEDVWTNDPAIFGVLFDAALSGFPNPPRGTRQIRTPLPVSGPAAPATPAEPTKP